MTTDLDVIKHLDFEVKEDTAPVCAGFRFRNQATGAVTSYKKCTDAAEIIATRTCCGMQVSYCVPCFNAICNYYAEGLEVIHTPCQTQFSGRPFLKDVVWL